MHKDDDESGYSSDRHDKKSASKHSDQKMESKEIFSDAKIEEDGDNDGDDVIRVDELSS